MEICDHCNGGYLGVKAWSSPDYCSNECYEQAELNREYGLDWPDIRGEIIERDGTCQDCGHGGEDRLMDVHHKKPLRTFNNLENANAGENLILLCRQCHRNRHKKAGNLS